LRPRADDVWRQIQDRKLSRYRGRLVAGDAIIESKQERLDPNAVHERRIRGSLFQDACTYNDAAAEPDE
jgi:hypothetical protein